MLGTPPMRHARAVLVTVGFALAASTACGTTSLTTATDAGRASDDASTSTPCAHLLGRCAAADRACPTGSAPTDDAACAAGFQCCAPPHFDDAGADDATTSDARDASMSDAATTDAATTDAATCAASDYRVIPCCGGPAPLPDAGTCTPPAPFCAALPASCSAGHECPGICPNAGSGFVDGTRRVVSCVCA